MVPQVALEVQNQLAQPNVNLQKVARVLNAEDSRNRFWHTVRIRDYPDAESAPIMADEFTRRK